MRKILITGANGQLGRCINDAATKFPDLEFVFVSKEEMDIENEELLNDFFKRNNFSHCINTAAYTNVDKAESESKKAFAINAEAVKNLALICRENDVILFHISTDYVFDGKKKSPYVETDATNPINVYGASKLKGEQYIQEVCHKFFIFRTSWLYSQYGHNFLKTILKYAEEGKPLTITTEQTGTPTNANDLAEAILSVISKESNAYGIYHYSNIGEATWYDFTMEISKFSGDGNTELIKKTDYYKTAAARPENSVLEKAKFQKEFKIDLINWKTSLKILFQENLNF